MSLQIPDYYFHLYELNEKTKCLELTEDLLKVLPPVVRFAKTRRPDIAQIAPTCLEINTKELLTGLVPIINNDGSLYADWYSGNHKTFNNGKYTKNALMMYYPKKGGYLMVFYARGWFPKHGLDNGTARRWINHIKKERLQQTGASKR